jgi:hypothetical protein
MISQNLSYTGPYNPYELIQQAGKKRTRKSHKSRKSMNKGKAKKSSRKCTNKGKTRKYKK